MAGRGYTIGINAVAVVAAQDLFVLKCSSTVPIELHAVTLGQKTLVNWEAKELQFRYVPATVTVTGGTSVTPRPVLPTDVASVTTCTINNTTLTTSSGTIIDLWNDDWNFLNGFYWAPAGVEDRWIIAPSAAVVVRLPTAPSASMTVSGTVQFSELG